jgi:hypothetical protein
MQEVREESGFEVVRIFVEAGVNGKAITLQAFNVVRLSLRSLTGPHTELEKFPVLKAVVDRDYAWSDADGSRRFAMKPEVQQHLTEIGR